MRLSSSLQYERDFANMMCEQGAHAERIASSGKMQNAVCDCILFWCGRVYLVEVKSTKFETFRISDKSQIERLLQVSRKQSVPALLAVRFKGNKWKQGKWVLKLIDENLKKVSYNETSDTI